ncbi:hypothetical protein SCHPADRAFT_912505 [Schizopora paradoxa]|uniref:Methyltransferase domain-containing protein n=1 Tax=Schizopora paradoxa TaxID=27342 RepID=A0A0H2S6H1_9AGAM|nr:hypothetical protein SCHPADRAFT_912505 [Schizopora paradoxa]
MNQPNSTWNTPLDDELYKPDEEAIEFFATATGISDREELKQHILRVQTKAFKEFPYPCIRVFEFMKLKLARLPVYQQFLELGKSRKGGIFLDLGCCFGNDSRKAVMDGWPVENVLASDLQSKFWEYGHELFISTPETFPARFVPGDIFDPKFLEEHEPFTNPPSSLAPTLDQVRSDKSLNGLRGHVSAVFTGAFSHLFDEEKQAEVARKLAGLLSPEPGSMLIGVQGGRKKKGLFEPSINGKKEYRMFCHSEKTWKELWEGPLDFFGTFPGNSEQYQLIKWSVTRMQSNSSSLKGEV